MTAPHYGPFDAEDTPVPAGGLVDHLNAAAELDEAPPRRQPGTLVEVFVEGCEPYTVRITNRERLEFEVTAARHKEWPSRADGQTFAMTFVTWAAARRAGRYDGNFAAWQNDLIDWDVLDEQVPADPTR